MLANIYECFESRSLRDLSGVNCSVRDNLIVSDPVTEDDDDDDDNDNNNNEKNKNNKEKENENNNNNNHNVLCFF